MRTLLYLWRPPVLYVVTLCARCHRDVWIGWPLLFDLCAACSTVARPAVAPDLSA